MLASKWACKIFAKSKHKLFSKETQKEVVMEYKEYVKKGWKPGATGWMKAAGGKDDLEVA